MGDASHDPAAEWANLQRSYVELRTELQLTEDPRLQVELLRKLSSYRARIAELDEAIETTTVSQTAPAPPQPAPSPTDRPTAVGAVPPGPVTDGVNGSGPAPPRSATPTRAARPERDDVTSELPAIGAVTARSPSTGPGDEPEAIELEEEVGRTSGDRTGPGVEPAPDLRERDDRRTTDGTPPPGAGAAPAPDHAPPPAQVPGTDQVRTRVAGRLVDQPLTLRFVVEGPPGAGTSTVVRQLAEQFHAEVHTTALAVDAIDVSWLEFTSGSYEGQPIRFEVCSLQGAGDPAPRRHLRSLCDAVILVTDSTPDGLQAALPHLAELDAHRADLGPLDAPEMAVFAHKEDLREALNATAVAKRLELPVETKVVSTTRERAGFRQGFGLATSTAVRRTQSRDDAELPRTAALDHDGFVAAIRTLVLTPPAHPDPTGPVSDTPVPVPATAADPVPPDQVPVVDLTPPTDPAPPSSTAPPADQAPPADPPPRSSAAPPASRPAAAPSTAATTTPPADPTGEIPGPPAEPVIPSTPRHNGVVAPAPTSRFATTPPAPEPGPDTPGRNDTPDRTGLRPTVAGGGSDDDALRELRTKLSEMDLAPETPTELPLGTAPADQGVIDLAGITRLDAESRVPRSRPLPDRPAGAARATLPRVFVRDDGTPAGIAPLTGDGRPTHPGLGGTPAAPDGPTPPRRRRSDSDGRNGGSNGHAPPPFTTDRQPRPRNGRSVPPSVLGSTPPPSPFPADQASPRPHPRDREPRPVGSDERSLSSLFEPRVDNGGWPPAPSAADRIGPNGATSPDVPGPLRRSALRRLISALKG